MSSRPDFAPVPGERLLHPVALAAVAVLLVNDHYLKSTTPCWLTGKVSDFCGLVFFPLFLDALWEWCCAAARRFQGHSTWSLIGGTVATGLVFTAVKTYEPAANAYSVVWGFLRWPLSAAWALASSAGWPAVRHVRIVSDATDLIALPCLAIAFWIGTRGKRVDWSILSPPRLPQQEEA